MTSAGYSRYERGEASSLFRPKVQARLAEALGSDVEALQAEVRRAAEAQP